MSEKSTIEQDRQRSELLKKQLTQMGEDFDFMKKSREEWKKQLDARFQDIERYIPNHAGKSTAANSILPTRPKGPTTLSWPSSTNSNSKSKRPGRIYRITSTLSPSLLTNASRKKTNKSPTSPVTSKNRPKTEITSSKRGRGTPRKR